MEMNSLRELYIAELQDLYSAEKQLVKALPKMADNATNPELRQAFLDHLAKTEEHVERLEQIFETLEASPSGKKCKGMERLIEEGEELVKEDPQEDVLDAGLISNAQHVEHYEIAGYGSVRTYALTLGEADHAELLQQTLDEEIEADELLTELAEDTVNIDALMADASMDESRASRRADRDVTRAAESEGRRSSKQTHSTTRSRSSGSGAPEMRDR